MKVLFLDYDFNDTFYNENRNKVEFVESRLVFKNNGLVNKIFRRLGKHIPFLFKLTLDSWKNHLNEYTFIVLSESKYSNFVYDILIKKNKKIVHWYWNPVSTTIKPSELKGELIYTFDYDDSVNYGIKHINTYYFSNIILEKNIIDIDVFFIGYDKGRLAQLLNYEAIFNKYNLITNFHIVKSDSNANSYAFKKKITYEESLKMLSKSKCIFDVIQDGQSGKSQRPMEALFYKKKLITTDKSIINEDFYKKENIFIIGIDDFKNLNMFINQPFIEDNLIVKKYDFKNWILKLNDEIL